MKTQYAIVKNTGAKVFTPVIHTVENEDLSFIKGSWGWINYFDTWEEAYRALTKDARKVKEKLNKKSMALQEHILDIHKLTNPYDNNYVHNQIPEHIIQAYEFSIHDNNLLNKIKSSSNVANISIQTDIIELDSMCGRMIKHAGERFCQVKFKGGSEYKISEGDYITWNKDKEITIMSEPVFTRIYSKLCDNF